MIVPPFDKLRVTGYEPALVMLSLSKHALVEACAARRLGELRST
jgi:hypothetical protein